MTKSRRPDVERRLMYVLWSLVDHPCRLADIITSYATNPNCWVFLAIAATAPRTQALALKNFFYRYLTSRTSLSILIPVSPVYPILIYFAEMQHSHLVLKHSTLICIFHTTPFIGSVDTMKHGNAMTKPL